MSIQSVYVASTEIILVSFVLVVYDHAITLDQEITYFWSGSWSAARTLYLSIRYLALIRACFSLYGLTGQVKTCTSVVRLLKLGVSLFGVLLVAFQEGNLSIIADYFLTLTVAVFCQAVVTLRVWHLFLHSCFIRWLAVTVFIICAVGAVIVTSVEFDAMKRALCASSIAEIFTQGPLSMLSVYLPALVIHTVMLLLTMYRFRVSPKALQQRGIMHRFVKEGIFMYTFAAGSLLYEIVCLSMTEPKDISIYYPSLIGGIAISTTTVSVCRAMLSIKSFTVTYHVDPAWLLNHAELSRVQWRRGISEGEIFVESSDMEVDPRSKLLEVSARRTEGEGIA